MTTNDQNSEELAEGAAAVDPILPLTLYGPEISYFTGKQVCCPGDDKRHT